MAFDIALSTMWANGRFPDLADFFRAGKALGFTRFELNHSVNLAMLGSLSLNGVITAVHEPCPAEIPVEELNRRNWLISAPDEESRRKGVHAARRSIDLAQQLGTNTVVVHPGRVDIDPALESALVGLYKAGACHQPEYVVATERLTSARAAQVGINMRSVRRSLLELAEYAAERGVRLGLENRLHYYEIPQPDELEDLLDLGCGDAVGYWHDVGHAQVLQHLGFGTQEEWLRRFGGAHGRMIGVHLHDVQGLTDHLPTGSGQVDWDMVAMYLPVSALRTCEFRPSSTPQQVVTGLRWLVDRGI